MTRTRRIIHHASWFTLLGPFIGMLLTIIGLMCITSDSAMRLLADILHMFSLFITLTWIIGAIPALLTGIIVAKKGEWGVNDRSPLPFCALHLQADAVPDRADAGWSSN